MSGKREFIMLANKWLHSLREGVPSSLCPFLTNWQLGPGLWSGDKLEMIVEIQVR